MSLIDGPLPVVLSVLGVVALALLALFPPARRWWLYALITMVGCAVVILAMDVYIELVWRPFPDPLATGVLVWAWAGLSAVMLALVHLLRKRWFAPLAAVLVVVAAVAGINGVYGYYPDVRTALGLHKPAVTDLSSGRSETVSAPEGGYLSDVWKGPVPTPGGALSTVEIRGVESGFKARQAYVYTPPAYQAVPRPLLPVLVLLAGQPGSPYMWIDGGQVVDMMDRYARDHNGLAPVVVIPDVLGDDMANPACVDSPRGNVETYLVKDVPEWVQANLQVATGPRHWAIGGLSSGGTCSLQMALRAPELYGRFVDISGDRELELRDKQDAIEALFGGDRARYALHNPPDILAAKKFPDTAARLVVGRDDGSHTTDARKLVHECQAAGMDVSTLELAGGHSWAVWRPGLEQSLPWLAGHTGLVRP